LTSQLATVSPPPRLAGLEVDRFLWPVTCEALLDRARDQIESVATLLRDQLDNGVGVVALAGTTLGSGCSTAVLSLGRVLSAAGLLVCLVDADFREPQLAECLGLESERGLENVLAGEAALADVLVESMEDNITLLPLSKPVAPALIERSKLRQTVTLGELRDHFDLVLVDAGHLHTPSNQTANILRAGSGIDAAILVSDAQSKPEELQNACRAIEQCDVHFLGVIENRLTA
jgi:Mrp family chromosome partitioning ATPase